MRRKAFLSAFGAISRGMLSFTGRRSGKWISMLR
jgi:hypothetical protein